MQIKPGQIISLKTALREVNGMTDDAHAYIISKLLNDKIMPLEELTIGAWKTLRDQLYPNWRDEDWTLANDMKARIADLLAAYREEITGQKRLF